MSWMSLNLVRLLGYFFIINQIWNRPKRKVFDAEDDLFLFDEAIGICCQATIPEAELKLAPLI